MRFLLKVEMPVEKANELAVEGKLGEAIQTILDDLEPEAAYFTTSNGNRAGYIFVDIEDASEIPAFAEPWFLALEADVDIVPVMTPEDLQKAGPGIERAVKKFA
ncbi:MAG: DUF3303 family protein [bacterium]